MAISEGEKRTVEKRPVEFEGNTNPAKKQKHSEYLLCSCFYGKNTRHNRFATGELSYILSMGGYTLTVQQVRDIFEVQEITSQVCRPLFHYRVLKLYNNNYV